MNGFRLEVNTDGDVVLGKELAMNVLVNERGLSDTYTICMIGTRVADYNNLETDSFQVNDTHLVVLSQCGT